VDILVLSKVGCRKHIELLLSRRVRKNTNQVQLKRVGNSQIWLSRLNVATPQLSELQLLVVQYLMDKSNLLLIMLDLVQIKQTDFLVVTL